MVGVVSFLQGYPDTSLYPSSGLAPTNIDDAVKRTGKGAGADFAPRLSFIGVMVRAPRKAASAGLSFAGSRAAPATIRALSAALSLSGHFLRGRLLVALLFLNATDWPSSNLYPSPGIYPGVNPLVKQTHYLLSGALSFTGAALRLASRALTAGLSFTGAVAKRVLRLLAAVLSFSGATARVTRRLLAAALSFTGSMVKSLARALTARLSFIAPTNYAANPNFDHDTVGGTPAVWTPFAFAVNPTLTVSNLWSKNGAQSLIVANPSALSNEYVSIIVDLGAFVAVGDTLSMGAWFNDISMPAGSLYFVQLGAYDVSSALISQVLSPAGTPNGSPQQVSGVNLTVPPGTVHLFAFAIGYNSTGGTLNMSYYVDQIQINKTANLPVYGDGDTFGWEWQGTAGASFSDQLHLLKQTLKALPGGLSFTGLIKRAVVASLTGVLSFSGSMTKQTRRALNATLSFAGSLPETIVYALAAALSFAGAISRRSSVSLPAGLSFMGGFGRNFIRLLTAILSFLLGYPVGDLYPSPGLYPVNIDTLTKQTGHQTPGGLSFAGTVREQISKGLSAALSFSGSARRAVVHGVTGGLSFSGSVLRGLGKGLVAFLSFLMGYPIGDLYPSTGLYPTAIDGLTKQTQRGLNAGLSFVGRVTKLLGRALSGALSFSGALARQAEHRLTATLSFAGARAVAIGRNLTAAQGFTGSVARAIVYLLSGRLSFAGLFVGPGQVVISAALSFTGATARGVSTSRASVISFTGVMLRGTKHRVAGALSFSGAFLRGRILRANLAFKGTYTLAISRLLPGALGLSGHAAKRIGYLLSSSLSFVGQMLKRAALALRGALASSGRLVRATSRPLLAALAPHGRLSRAVRRSLAAALSTAGSAAFGMARKLLAALSLSGRVLRLVGYRLMAGLGFSGRVLRSIARSLSGALSFVGRAVTDHILHRTLTAAISFSGSMLRGPVFFASLRLVGALRDRARRVWLYLLSLFSTSTAAVADDDLVLYQSDTSVTVAELTIIEAERELALSPHGDQLVISNSDLRTLQIFSDTVQAQPFADALTVTYDDEFSMTLVATEDTVTLVGESGF